MTIIGMSNVDDVVIIVFCLPLKEDPWVEFKSNYVRVAISFKANINILNTSPEYIHRRRVQWIIIQQYLKDIHVIDHHI